MKRVWVATVLMFAWTVAFAQEELSSVLERLELQISADKTELDGDAQILSGHVRVEILSEEGQVILIVRAGRAERQGQELEMQQGVRLEAPRGVTGAGLESLLDTHGLTLSEARVEAESVYLHAGQQRIEIRQLDARAAGGQDGKPPRVTLQAEHVVLILDDDGYWRSRMTRPRAGFRFD